MLPATLSFARAQLASKFAIVCEVWRVPDSTVSVPASYESGYGDADVPNNPVAGSVSPDKKGRQLHATYLGRVTAPKANKASEEDATNQVVDEKTRVTVELPWNATVRHDDVIKVHYPANFFDDYPAGTVIEYEVEIINPHDWAISQHIMCSEIVTVNG